MKNFKQLLEMNKKGQLSAALYGLLVLGLFLTVVGYILAFGADFISDQQATFTASSYAANITTQSLSAMSVVGTGQGTIATVGILVIVVGLLVGVIAALGFAGRGRSQF